MRYRAFQALYRLALLRKLCATVASYIEFGPSLKSEVSEAPLQSDAVAGAMKKNLKKDEAYEVTRNSRINDE